MTTQGLGLLLFSVSVALNVAGIAIDLALKEQDMGTVTDFARRNQWLAALIILSNMIGLIGLILHFSDGKD